MGIIKNRPMTFIVEGATEQAVLKSLGIRAKNVQFKILENPVKKKLATFKEGDFYLVLDLDEISKSRASAESKRKSCLSTFKSNVRQILKDKRCKKLYFILQYYNLEDELAKACSLSVNSFTKLMKAKNLKELKEKIVKSQNLYKTLEGIGFQEERFWAQSFNEICEEHRAMFKEILQSPGVEVVTLADIIMSK